MTIQDDLPEIKAFCDILGLREDPLGLYYTPVAPREAISPQAAVLPSAELERAGELDWEATFANFSCVIGVLWRARRLKRPACFDQTRFGCLGGAFYLGFLKPQLERVVHYVSTGQPGVFEGECYLDSAAAVRRFFEVMDPRPAPEQFCVFKQLSQFSPDETPEVVIFFGRAETISGLHQLATFVTNDFEVVQSPFGAGCTNIVSWPLKYLERGQLKAVLGGWDPSDRKFLKPDEITLALPYELFARMVQRWRESFLTKEAWKTVRQKIELSRKAWKEQ